jgi:hypothetical protein
LLSGTEASEARRVALEVAAAIERRPSPGDGISVAGGAAGFALLNAYLAAVLDDAEAERRAVAWLDRAIDGVGADASLYAGATGVAWAAEHVSRLLGIEGSDPDGAMEAALVELLDSTPWPGDFDLVSGLAGHAVHALERLPRPEARRCLQLVVARLDELAERTPEGVTWFRPPRLLPEHQLEGTPDGHYNLGVAHGVPGVIAVLAAAAGVGAERARPLTEDAIRWLLAQRLPLDAPAAFAAWAAPGQEPIPARAAWCYGDPGVAASLLAASRALGADRLHQEAVALARRAAARRDPVECRVEDPWLCHGAAGLGHLYNRVHQATEDEVVGDAARLWLRRALEMRSQSGNGFAGFHPAAGREQLDGDGSHFLTGATGVALALLAAASDVEPGWDRLLAVSLREAPA